MLGIVHIARGAPRPSMGAEAMRHGTGWIGWFASAPLSAVFSQWVTVPLLVMLTFFGLLVTTATPVYRIPARLRNARSTADRMLDTAFHGRLPEDDPRVDGEQEPTGLPAVVDECPNIDRGRRDLETWAAALASRADHPVLSVFLDTANRYEIPVEYAFELIEGMRMDLNQTRYQTFDELRLFCYRVASVVGLMMSWVIGFEDPADREGDSRMPSILASRCN